MLSASCHRSYVLDFPGWLLCWRCTYSRGTSQTEQSSNSYRIAYRRMASHG